MSALFAFKNKHKLRQESPWLFAQNIHKQLTEMANTVNINVEGESHVLINSIISNFSFAKLKASDTV